MLFLLLALFVMEVGMSRLVTKPTKWHVRPAKDRPTHPPSLISLRCHMKKARVLGYPLSAQRRLIRLGGCPGWSESSLGAHITLLVLSWGGSYFLSKFCCKCQAVYKKKKKKKKEKKEEKWKKMSSFKSNENIHKKEDFMLEKVLWMTFGPDIQELFHVFETSWWKGNYQEPMQSNPRHQTGKEHKSLRRHKVKQHKRRSKRTTLSQQKATWLS